MTSNKMFIPGTIKVGYQNRKGTYTGKLAYVIYFDEKGKLRKEASWKGWRDNKITPNEFSNDPIEGFVLNKGVGGVSDSWSFWNTRNEYIRVYDPRDFEFEISVSNLLFILQETSAIKGKGLEGEFVYAWDGTELVLLPVGCEEYKACKVHTALQGKKISKEEIKEGYTYILKDGSNVMYLGRFPFNNITRWNREVFNPIGNKHMFLKLDKIQNEIPYFYDSGFTKVAECTSNSPSANYANARDEFLQSKYYINIAEVKLTANTNAVYSPNYYTTNRFLIKDGDKFRIVEVKGAEDRSCCWSSSRKDHSFRQSAPFIPQAKKGNFSLPFVSGKFVEINNTDRDKFETYDLYVITDSGTQIKVI
jgi:hypothetical protein